jgi:hypothetical protein
MSVNAPPLIEISSTLPSKGVVESSKTQRFLNVKVAEAETMVIGGDVRTSSAMAAPENPNAEFGAVSLLVLTVVQGSPSPVTDVVHPEGSAGAVTPSKFAEKRGPQTSVIVQPFPSSHALVLLVEMHPPVAGLQDSVVQTLESGLQTIGFCPTHTPLWQTSGDVHRLESEQVFVLSGVKTQPEPGLQLSSVQALLSLQTSGGNWHAPVAGLQLFCVHGLPSLQLKLFVNVHTEFTQVSSVQRLLSLQSVSAVHTETTLTHHPLMFPEPMLRSSTTQRFQAPLGFCPMNVDSGDPGAAGGAGAGAGHASVPVEARLVGLKVPVVNVDGIGVAAASLSVRLTPLTLAFGPTSDMMIALGAARCWSITSMSSGKACVRPFRFTVTRQMYVFGVETEIDDGYGDAVVGAVASEMVMPALLQNWIGAGSGAVPGTQTPPPQASPIVQRLLSVQGAALLV